MARTVTTVLLHESGRLELVRLSRPEPGHDEIVVRFEGSALNPADQKIRSGLIRPRAGVSPWVLGWDLVGRVVSVGEDVTGFAHGDRVIGMTAMASTGRGTWSDHVAMRASSLAHAPERLDVLSLAQLPLVGLTAVKAIEELAPRTGDEVLVVGAAGAVGRLVVQLLGLRDVAVHALVRTPEQAEGLDGLGIRATWVDTAPTARFGGVIDSASADAAYALKPGGTYVTTTPGTLPSGSLDDSHVARTALVSESGAGLEVLVGLLAVGSISFPEPRVFELDLIEDAFDAFAERSGKRIVLVAGTGTTGPGEQKSES